MVLSLRQFPTFHYAISSLNTLFYSFCFSINYCHKHFPTFFTVFIMVVIKYFILPHPIHKILFPDSCLCCWAFIFFDSLQFNTTMIIFQIEHFCLWNYFLSTISQEYFFLSLSPLPSLLPPSLFPPSLFSLSPSFSLSSLPPFLHCFI